MAELPLVSVVMSVLEPHPVYFPAAVRSVLEQTYHDWELVIVEDPSPRSCRELLRELQDGRIRHYLNPSRTSHVAQRNSCLSLARGNFVAVLDADDRCAPDRIQKQVAYLDAHPDISVLGTQLEVIDASDSHCGWRRYPLDHRAILRAMPLFNPLAQPSVMFRKHVVLQAGGYRYQKYPAEDYELWSRLARQGVRFANRPEPLLQYRIHSGGMKATKLKGTLRGTLDIKRTYWADSMNCRARLRMCLEHALLALPPALIYRLFTKTHYRKLPILVASETRF